MTLVALESPSENPALCTAPIASPNLSTTPVSPDLPVRMSWTMSESLPPSMYSFTSTFSSRTAPTILGVATPLDLSVTEAWYSLCILAWGDVLNLCDSDQTLRSAHFTERMSAKYFRTNLASPPAAPLRVRSFAVE